MTGGREEVAAEVVVVVVFEVDVVGWVCDDIVYCRFSSEIKMCVSGEGGGFQGLDEAIRSRERRRPLHFLNSDWPDVATRESGFRSNAQRDFTRYKFA